MTIATAPARRAVPVAAEHDSQAGHHPPASPPPVLTAASREALWRHAGLERDAAGLRTLLDDEHPLVRLIATGALVRTESRGAHVRRDHPELEAGFDHIHVTLGGDGEPVLAEWH